MQAEIAIKEADVVVFIVDGKEGLTHNDLIVRDILRKSDKRIIVAINKIDVKDAQNNLYDFYELGFDTYIPISSIHNIGFVDLMDTVTMNFIESEEVEDTRIKFSIIGRPNVGKSSLLNALLQEDKAIVTDIAGTTRDIVEGQISINGIILNMIDTAGIRETEDKIEAIGVEKSLKTMEESDLVLFVLNNNEELTKDVEELLNKIEDKNYIIIVNKIDLENKLDLSKVKINKENIINMSIVNNQGIEELKEKIIDMFNLSQIETKDPTYLSNTRSIGILQKCLDSIEEVEKGINNNMPIDMIELDIRNIWEQLGEINGSTYEEELLDEMFSRFCLGK